MARRRALAVLGAPGSGKGTQARLLARRWKATHLDVGGLLRERARSADQLGADVHAALGGGQLASDEDVLSTVSAALRDAANHRVVLDGFPRTEVQATAVDMGAIDLELLAVFWLEVADVEARIRVRNRLQFEDRPDDVGELSARRRSALASAAAPVRDRYEKRGLLYVIDGLGSVNEVEARIDRRLARVAGYDVWRGAADL